MLRIEVKLLISAAEQERVEAWLRTHSGAFSTAFPPRIINNVYFDSFEARAFAENFAGVSDRSKLRYRWYGPEELPASGVLEVKHRKNRFGWKEQFPVPALTLDGSERWMDIVRSIRSQVAPPGRAWLDAHPQPILINRYRRRYFVTHDQRVRATIDTGLVVFDQRTSPTPRRTGEIKGIAPCILEIKAAREDVELVHDVLEEIPIRVSRSSKYVAGFSAIAGQ